MLRRFALAFLIALLPSLASAQFLSPDSRPRSNPHIFNTPLTVLPGSNINCQLGVIVTNTSCINITGTLNAAGTTFDAPFFMNVTNTASHTGSLAFDVQVGGISQFKINAAANGVQAGQLNIAPISMYLADTSAHANAATNVVVMYEGLGASTFLIANTSRFGWNSGASFNSGAAPDTALARDAAGIIAQVNSTNAQIFRVYNTFTSGTSYERGVMDWATNANVFTIGTEKGSGGGSVRNMEFEIGGTNQLDYGVTLAGGWTFNGNIVHTDPSGSNSTALLTVGTGSSVTPSNIAETIAIVKGSGKNYIFVNSASGQINQMDFDENGTLRLSMDTNNGVGGTGGARLVGSPNSIAMVVGTANNNALDLFVNNAIAVTVNANSVALGSSADTILSRIAAATLQFGAADAAAPVAQTTEVQSVVAGTSNTAGTNWTINGSKGTGTGVGGNINLQTAAAGTTGTSQNALATVLSLQQNGHVAPGFGTPTANSCTGFVLATGSNDAVGQVSFNSATSCSITFQRAYTNAPFCQITPGSAASTVEVVTTTGGFTATLGTANTTLYYHCFGT